MSTTAKEKDDQVKMVLPTGPLKGPRRTPRPALREEDRENAPKGSI